MKASRLGVRPGVERPDDLPTMVRVGTPWLTGAAVAHVGASAVPDDAQLEVEFVRPEMLSLRTLPAVVIGVVRETGGAIAKRTSVCVCADNHSSANAAETRN